MDTAKTQIEHDKIEKKINEIVKNRFQDSGRQRILCDELVEMGKQENDCDILGTALYYKAETFFGRENAIAEKLLKQSINYLSNGKNYEVLARAYNLIGIIANDKEEFSAALNYYLISMDICEEHELNYVRALCACNVGVIFHMTYAYDKAIQYYAIGKECFEKDLRDPHAVQNRLSILINMGYCYYDMGEPQKLKECIDEVRKNEQNIKSPLGMYLLEAKCAKAQGETQKTKEYIRLTVDSALQLEDVLEEADIFQTLCDFLFELEEYEYLMPILNLLEEKIPKENFPKIRINLLKYRLAYLEKKRAYEEYIQWSKEYIKTYEAITDSYNRSVLDAAELRVHMREMEQNEREIRRLAQTDKLTGLNNRNGFSKKTEKLIERARQIKSPIAVFIIDVDYFKQINDTYGHTYGDQCLEKIGQALLRIQNNQIVSGRYGGDEFTVMCCGYDTKDAEQIAIEIRQYIADAEMESKASPISDYVTVSQGITVGVPAREDSFGDFLHCADEALYKVKESGRNGYFINEFNLTR